MITTKENGTQYTMLNKIIVKFHDDNNLTLADVNRPLTYTDGGEYIDDITAEEIEAGYEAIRDFLYREITDPLFFKAQRGEVKKSVWLTEVQKIKDENKPKTETKDEPLYKGVKMFSILKNIFSGIGEFVKRFIKTSVSAMVEDISETALLAVEAVQNQRLNLTNREKFSEAYNLCENVLKSKKIKYTENALNIAIEIAVGIIKDRK